MSVLDRFLKYVSFDTTSDEKSETIPSAAKEKLLGEYLREELLALGLSDVRMDEYGYVYASLKANTDENIDPIGLIAHMDTSPAVSGTNVKPSVIKYEGGAVRLCDSVSIDPEEYPSLNKYIGEELVVTDGTTLLGADDKAGVAEIVSAIEYLIENPEIKHGDIYIGFTPDEEIGRGADKFDLENFKAKYAYTVDGGAIGEIEYENFNAASASIYVKGFNIHTGDAKGKMINSALIVSEIISCFPADEIPAKTEGYEGFYHICYIRAHESDGIIDLIIRDHDRERFEERKAFVKSLEERFNSIYKEGTVTVSVKDSYYNMKEKILPVMYIVDNAKKAMEDAGVVPKDIPIRGGTDGARLSYEGLPCPNLSTGGENFHSKCEYIPVSSLEKMVKVLVNICKR